MIDPFGNYLCQKIIELSSQIYLKKIVLKIFDFSIDICKNSHGTRAFQKIYEFSDNEIVKILNESLKNHIVDLIKVFV